MCFSLAGDTHRDALVHLPTQFFDWLAGGAHWDEDILFQCRHTGGHEQLGQGYEPGCPDANTDSEEVSDITTLSTQCLSVVVCVFLSMNPTVF